MNKDPLNTLGASNHSKKQRSELDYYGTAPSATLALLERETFNKNVWEPCVGHHKMSDVLESAGYNVKKSDIFSYGLDHEIIDFLDCIKVFDGDIITNPPYNCAQEFIQHALELIPSGRRVFMFLKIQFLEGKERKKLFTEYPPKTIYVSSSRLLCAKNGEFEKMKAGGGSAVAYAWYVWVKGYKGDTVVKWIN